MSITRSEKSLTETPVRLSASSLSSLNECPRKWYFKYIEQRTEPPGEAAMVGSFIHEVLENFYLYTPEFRTATSMQSLARSLWDEFAEKFHEAFPTSPRSEAEIKKEVWRALTGIWEFEDPQEVKVHSVEMEVKAQYEGFPFIGYVDRIDVSDDTLVIVDYKGGKALNPNYANTKLMQLLLYCWALEQLDLEAHRAKLYFVRERQLVQVDMTKQSRKAVLDYMKKSVEKLNGYFDQEFPPKPSPLCGWCPHITSCPEGQNSFWYFSNAGKMRKDAPAYDYLLSESRGDCYTDEDDFRSSFGR